MEKIKEILEKNKLNDESIVYRFTSPEYLIKLENQEFLKVNDDPKEMIIDSYDGQGHTFMARDIGPGLSFLTEPLDEYERDDRICVSIKVKDLLDVGGQVYEVTSLPAYINAFFFKLPVDRIKISRDV